jgi:hypothetical protein
MLSKLIIFGAGYVLGAKAGRERYEQIVAFAQDVAKRLDEYRAQEGLPPVTSRGARETDSRSGSQTKKV